MTEEILHATTSDIVPTYSSDDENPNRMNTEEYAALVEAIKTNGFLQPILVHRAKGKKWGVIDGHHRLRAAVELGLPTVPVLCTNKTGAIARGIAVGMNHIRGELDMRLAAKELRELHSCSFTAEQLASLSGFSLDDIEALVTSQEDEILELDEQPPAPAASTRTAAALHTLEITFASKEEYQFARRKLRKAAGPGNELSAGLMTILEDAE